MERYRRIRRTLRHDWPAVFLVAASLFAIGVYLLEGVGGRGGSGYRVIDFATVKRLIDQGQLNRHQARWYHREEGQRENLSFPEQSKSQGNGGAP